MCTQFYKILSALGFSFMKFIKTTKREIILKIKNKITQNMIPDVFCNSIKSLYTLKLQTVYAITRLIFI